MYVVCGGWLWEHPKFGILSRVSNFKGRWMRTTHLVSTMSFSLFVLWMLKLNLNTAWCEGLPEATFSWNTLFPTYSVLSDPMNDSLLLYLYRYSYLVTPRPWPDKAGTTSTTIKKYKLINNTADSRPASSSYIPLKLSYLIKLCSQLLVALT